MIIVTVNLSERQLERLGRLVYNEHENTNGIYPSRSELIRVAVKDFLMKEIQKAKNLILTEKNTRKEKPPVLEDIDDEKFIRIPGEKRGEHEFKLYKVIKRLDYANDSKGKTDPNPPKPEPVPARLMNHDFLQDAFEPSMFPSYHEIERSKPSLQQLRAQHPDMPDYKYMNEDIEWRA